MRGSPKDRLDTIPAAQSQSEASLGLGGSRGVRRAGPGLVDDAAQVSLGYAGTILRWHLADGCGEGGW